MRLHAVVQRWTGSFGAGVIAGAAFTATPWVLRGGIVAAPNYAVLPYFPFIVFLAARPTSARTAAALALLVALQGLTSVYVAVAVLVPLGLLAGVRIVRHDTRAAGLRLAAALVAASAALALAFAGHAVVRADNPGWRLQSAWRFPGSVMVALEEEVGSRSPSGVPQLVLALVATGALLRAWRRADPATPREMWMHGAFWAIAGSVISLRPRFSWHGLTIALPDPVVSVLEPFWHLIRFPERLAIAALGRVPVLALRRWAPPGGRRGRGERDRRGAAAQVPVGVRLTSDGRSRGLAAGRIRWRSRLGRSRSSPTCSRRRAVRCSSCRSAPTSARRPGRCIARSSTGARS